MTGAGPARRFWITVLVVLLLWHAPGVVQSQETADYIKWLEERSMLRQAQNAVSSLGENGSPWRHPYGKPRPETVLEEASVWVLAYPGSVITGPDESVIAAWADPGLWDAFREIGIDLLHTGPVQRAGGIRDHRYTPSIDGWFDPISLEIDPQLGTAEEYRRLVEVAGAHGGGVAGDLVPLHTGKGADFLLGLRAYKDYPGMYIMAEIRKDDWNLLPEVGSPWDSAPVSQQAAKRLQERGYIPGLIHSNDAAHAALELTGWDATGTIPGADGRPRRWVYLHFFKPGQPALNWIDPSSAAQRAVDGGLVQAISGFGARGLRLDAVPFLGIEPVPGSPMTLHYQHPLSVLGTNHLAFLARRLGGWTYQELNVPLSRLRVFVENGPDLSYDFFTRTETLHALLTGDAALLRQAFRFLKEEAVEPGWLVHDLQNHDEITYQLVELDARPDEVFCLDGKEYSGRQLREKTLDEMRAKAAGPRAPFNKLYRPQRDGVATTFAGFLSAALEIADPYRATADQVEQIKRAHLLLAFANAMQPGVFSLSSWDLAGALPLPADSVAERLADQDYRWINRGGVDLLGKNPGAARSACGLPRAQVLYGPLPQQLRDPGSFASQLKKTLEARRRHRIYLGKLVAVPEVEHRALCVVVFSLPDRGSYCVTALNFGKETVRERIDLGAIVKCDRRSLAGRKLLDAVTGRIEGALGADNRLDLKLERHCGKSLILPR